MANELKLLVVLAAALLAGCVSVENRGGLNPPVALFSTIKGTIGVPRDPIPMERLKSAKTDGTVHLREWVFSGISAGIVDMALQSAVAKGDLKKVYYADYEQTSYLGFVTVFNIVAYGE